MPNLNHPSKKSVKSFFSRAARLAVMMLAESGLVESLAESFRRQCLDDSIKTECFGHLVGYTPQSVPYRAVPSCCNNVIYRRDKKHERCKDRRGVISRTFGESKPRPLNDRKIHETFIESSDPELQTGLPEIRFSIKQKGSSNKESSREISSSSEEELSELCSINKFFLSNEVSHLMASSCPVRLISTDKMHSTRTNTKYPSNKDSNRKRYKTTRGCSKKKIKVARPSLDLDKMLATRLNQGSSNLPKNGDIFIPIDAT